MNKTTKEDKDKPYLLKHITTTVRLYNPEYGDNRICRCGHTYDRHFDGFEETSHQDVGCKYCDCSDFAEEAAPPTRRFVVYGTAYVPVTIVAFVRTTNEFKAMEAAKEKWDGATPGMRAAMTLNGPQDYSLAKDFSPTKSSPIQQ